MIELLKICDQHIRDDDNSNREKEFDRSHFQDSTPGSNSKEKDGVPVTGHRTDVIVPRKDGFKNTYEKRIYSTK